jgi:hypothetical protein
VAKKSNGLFGWLGRQVGYVKGGVKAEVPKVVYQQKRVEEARVEGTDQVLRRTVIDEVIVESKRIEQKK